MVARRVSLALAAALAASVVPACRGQDADLPDIHEKVDMEKDDISNDGACKDVIKHFCPETKQGDGAVAHCLRSAIKASRERKEPSVQTPECSKEMKKFFFKVMKHELPAGPLSEKMKHLHNKSLWVEPVRGMRKACHDDMKEHCSGKRGHMLMTCLKDNKEKLTEACKQKVFHVQEMQAEDMTLDIPFFTACKEDLEQHPECREAPPSKRKACLAKNRETLTPKCLAAHFKKDVEHAEDIRLDKDLFSTCQDAIKSVCKDTEFGEARMLRCLWDQVVAKKGADDTYEECATKVSKLVGKQVADYRLDFRVRTKCDADITKHCNAEKEIVDKLPMDELFGEHGKSGEVLKCLKTNLQELESGCQQEMSRVARVQALHADADPEIKRKCKSDIDEYCHDVPRAGLHMCLRRNLKKLSEECREAELTQGKMESGKLSMKPALKRVCGEAEEKYCKEAQGSRGKLRCLQDHMNEDGFPSECRDEVQADLEASNHDWRLKYGISSECQDDVRNSCKEAMTMEMRGESGGEADGEDEPGGGVLRCLADRHKQNGIVSPSCKEEVGRYLKQGAFNIKVMPEAFRACAGDVRQFCPHVPVGKGRVHECLLKHKHDLSQACAKAEFENQELQMNDITMSPEAQQYCKPVMQKLCPGITPGEGRVWDCLGEHISSPDMPKECAEVVKVTMQLKQVNFFFNKKLVTHCVDDAQELCMEELKHSDNKEFQTNGGVISCLIKNHDKVKSADCKADLKKMQAHRAADARLDPEHKDVCERDIVVHCSEEAQAAENPKSKGKIHKCLQAHFEELSEPCKALESTYMVMASTELIFNMPVKKHCSEAKKRWCDDIEDGKGKLVQCLLGHLHDDNMEGACRGALEKEQAKRAMSIKFNPQVLKACSKEMARFNKEHKCTGGPSASLDGGRGKWIDCLTENRKEIQDPDCTAQVNKVLVQQVSDVRAVPGMEKACSQDLEALCPGVKLGGARGHECLQEKVEQISSPECKHMVLKIHNLTKRSALFNFGITKHCANEKKVFCADVQPGESRLLKCLALHRNETGFSEGCQQALFKTSALSMVRNITETMRSKLFLGPRGNKIEKSMEDLQFWIKSHRSFAEEHGSLLLGGTVGFVAMLTAWISWCVLRGKFLGKGGYTVVVPREGKSSSSEADEVQLVRRIGKGSMAA
jgi:Golgi apparatus protein 1